MCLLLNLFLKMPVDLYNVKWGSIEIYLLTWPTFLLAGSIVVPAKLILSLTPIIVMVSTVVTVSTYCIRNFDTHHQHGNPCSQTWQYQVCHKCIQHWKLCSVTNARKCNTVLTHFIKISTFPTGLLFTGNLLTNSIVIVGVSLWDYPGLIFIFQIT